MKLWIIELTIALSFVLPTHKCLAHRDHIDIAHLEVIVQDLLDAEKIQVIAQNTDCYKCSFVELGQLKGEPGQTLKAKLYSNHSTILKLIDLDEQNNTSRDLCQNFTIAVKEKAQYKLMVTSSKTFEKLESSEVNCTLVVDDSGVDGYLPILYMFITLAGLSLLWIILKQLYKRKVFQSLYVKLRLLYGRMVIGITCGKCGGLAHDADLVRADLGSTNTTTADEVDGQTTPPAEKSSRLRSLDTFRGLSLTIMIFVNYGGGKYWFFSHSSWNGLTVADLVFPWFIFIMGTAIAIVFNSSHRKGKNKWKMFYDICIRTIRLFVLGLMINSAGKSGNDLNNLRIPGVLQRFAVTYFVVALTELVFSFGYKKSSQVQEGQHCGKALDIVYFWPNLFISLLFVIAHVTVTYFVPYDMNGCPTGYIGPGGISEDSKYFNCTGGIAKYIDVNVFGPSRIYQHGTCVNLYQCPGHDPEGLLGVLTSIFLCFLGVHSGRIICLYQSVKGRVVRWIIWSVALGAITLLLCGASQNAGWIPINKNLWSASFVTAQAASGFFLLAVLYMLIDVWKIWSGAPFHYPGMNSILVYVGSEVFEDLVPVSFQVSQTHMHQLFINLWSTSFWVLFSAYLYYKKIFISV